MRIRFAGPKVVRRIVGRYEWSAATGFVQSVDAETAADLLTSPDGRFVVDGDDPLTSLVGVGPQRAAELALAGIDNLADLAGLDRAGEKRLVEALGVSAKQVRQWVTSALAQGDGVQADQEENV